MVNIKFPKRPHQPDGLSAALQLEVLAVFIEPDLGRGSDQFVPAKIVGRDERARIGEISPRQNGESFLPIGRSGAGRQRKKTRASTNRNLPSQGHRSTFRCRSARCNKADVDASLCEAREFAVLSQPQTDLFLERDIPSWQREIVRALVVTIDHLDNLHQDVIDQGAGAETEEIGSQPIVT